MKTIVAIVVLIGVLVYLNFGTLSLCGMLRESIRRHDNLAAALPDSLVDLALVAQYGALSPGRCLGILLNGQNTPVTATPAAPQPKSQRQASRVPLTGEEALRAAFKETETAMNECRTRRLSGELKTFVASVQCSNPRIVQAFGAANYRYMDLIATFTAKRLQVAQRIDRNELTESQAQSENTKLFNEIVEVERQRDNGRR
jgi:hypothetical protein